MANVYRFSKQANPAHYRVDPAGGSNAVSMGDAVFWDTGNKWCAPLVDSAKGQYFLGVAEGVAPTPTSNIDNVAGLEKTVEVRSNGIFTFIKTTADSLSHGDELVIGANPQTVLKRTVEDAADVIGFAWLPEASAALTGAGDVDVLIRSNFPVSGILV
jgi:predicted RecA/RadA family phage recombinase